MNIVIIKEILPSTFIKHTLLASNDGIVSNY